MATFEISNYIKLLCIRVDHFESFLVAEKNTNSSDEIEEFINRYKDVNGVKMIFIKMNSMETITFDEIKKFIQNVHIFDYVRHLASKGHKMIAYDEDEENTLSLGVFVKQLLSTK